MARSCAAIASLLLVFCMASPCLATVYTVGDTSGWTSGEDYSSWSSGITFRVGDSLVFNYGGGHTVDEVAETDYKTCTASNLISTDSSGSTSVELKEARTRYFICGVAGHCGSGMKLSITVGSGSGSPPTTTTGTTASPPSTATPTSTVPSNSPPQSSFFVGWFVFRVVFLLV